MNPYILLIILLCMMIISHYIIAQAEKPKKEKRKQKFKEFEENYYKEHNENELKNLYFLRFDAEYIEEIFEKDEIGRIYLNFSDPWPKDRHAKRRLPSRQFLARFDKILKKDGNLEFKTDNRDLFDFAVEEVEPAGWKTDAITYDLHHDEKMNQGNVMTEYEEKFSSKGNPIYKYIISR